MAPSITLAGADTATEGDTYTLTISATDPGTEYITQYHINWGDGTPVESFDATDTTSMATFTHNYADNQAGQTSIKVTVTDQSGTYPVNLPKEKLITVANVAPVIQNLTATPTTGTLLLEGSTATLTGTIVDPGRRDSFNLAINWGDGDSETIPLNTGATNFQIIHEYDNDGNYPISVTLTDDDGGSVSDSTSISVSNADPQATLNLSANAVDEGTEFTLFGIISDLGLNDTHNVTVSWGNGDSSPATVVGNTFSASYTYDDDNPTNTPLDTYTITAVVTDNADSNSSVSPTIDIEVANANPLLFTVTSNADTIDTAVSLGGTVTVSADFYDPGFLDTFTGEVIWGDGTTTTDPTITYDPGTQTGTITASHIYNTEAIYDVTVQLTDDDTGMSEVLSALALVGTYTNSAPVVDDQTLTVAEDATDGTVVGTVVVNDPDVDDTLTYSLELQNEFAIDEQTGEITVKSGSLFNAETNNEYTLTVTVTDFFGESDTAVVTVQLTDVNEFAPSLLLNGNFYEINEFSANGTVIDTVEASDRDADDTITFSLDPTTPFTIDPVSGEITVSDSSALDYDVTPQFVIEVIATDQGGLTDSSFLFISLLEQGSVATNNAPTITSQSFSIDENQSAVGSVPASDADLPLDSLTFSITNNGADDGFFSITSDGVLSFHTAPDYDIPGDADGNNTYEVEVRVQDSFGESATATMSVTVDPVNDNFPIFTSSTTVQVIEGTTTVQTLAATDADLPAQTLSYAITGGADMARFQLVDSDLSFVTAPDYESFADSDGDNIYEVDITVSDNAGKTTTQTVFVEIINADPTAPVDSDNSTNSVTEGAVSGTGTGLTITATDAGNSSVTFQLTDDANGRFAIDPDSGEVTVADGSLLDGPESHTITVQVSDGFGGTESADFEIIVNNADPEITSLAHTGNVQPGDTVTLTGSYVDAGVNDTHTATVNWGDGSATEPVTLDPLTGAISGTHSYADAGDYTITVIITDDDNGSDTATVNVSVSGNNDYTIEGTDSVDRVVLTQRGTILRILSYSSSTRTVTTVDTTTIEGIRLNLGDGNDILSVSSGLSLPIIVNAGAGNDYIITGSGDDILIGGTGRDTLLSGTGNDILIGGDDDDFLYTTGGHNLLIGGEGGDILRTKTNTNILIGGSTIYDDQESNLEAIRQVWSSTDTFESRIDQLRTGSNGVTLEANTTVLSDEETDQILSLSGRNWFFAKLDEDRLYYLSDSDEVDEV